MKTLGVECPDCGGLKTKVTQSNLDIESNRVRYRHCEGCGHQFSTVEVAVPGLSFPRTQRSERNHRVLTPQYVKVVPHSQSVTVRVYGPRYETTCRKKLHPWTPDNIYTSPNGRTTCKACRRDGARERYHHARRSAPPSILEDQRRRWREAKRAA